MASLIERFRAFASPESLAKYAADKAVQKQASAGNFPAIFPSAAQNSSFGNNYSNTQEQMQSYTDWVYACERAIAEHVATIDFRLYVNRSSTKTNQMAHRIMNSPRYLRELSKKTVSVDKKILRGGKFVTEKALQPAVEELENHPLLDLLHNPNPFMTKDEFFEMLVNHQDLAGNAYVVKVRNKSGMPVALFPLNPVSVRIVPDEQEFIKGYVYYPPNHGDPVPFAATEILHFKNTNPLNIYQGMSVVQAAARAIDTDNHAADYNRNFFYNSAKPAGLITLTDRITEESYTRLVDEWNDTYGGAANAHKVGVLESGATYQDIGLSQKDMDFLESRKFNQTMIMAIFRVPPSILGITTDVNRANAEAADYTFAKGVVKPKMMRLCSRLTQSLAPDFDIKLLVSFTDPVPEDKAFVLQEKTAAVNSWKTIDEVRAMEGDDPLSNNSGSTMYLSNTLVPIDETSVSENSPLLPAKSKPNDEGENNLEEVNEPDDLDDGDPGHDDATRDDPDADDENGSNGSGGSQSSGSKGLTKKDLQEAIATAVKLALEEHKSQNTPVKKVLYADASQRKAIGDKFTDTIDRIAKDSEVKFLQTSRKIFDAQKNRVLGQLSSVKSFKRKDAAALDALVAVLKESKEAWKKGFHPIYHDLMKAAGNEAISVVVGDTEFDADAPDVSKYIDQRGDIVADSIDTETAKQLRASLTEGINNGEDYQALSARVESVFGAAAGFRADRIARTESINAANTANVDAWQQSDVVEGKEWYTAQDANVCEWCDGMDGTTTGLDDNFYDQGSSMTNASGKVMNFDFEDIDTPPLHGNCRCVLLPVLK